MVLGGDNSQPVHSAKTGVAPIAVVITKMVSNFLVDVSVCLCMEWQPVWQWLSFWKPKLQEAGISLLQDCWTEKQSAAAGDYLLILLPTFILDVWCLILTTFLRISHSFHLTEFANLGACCELVPLCAEWLAMWEVMLALLTYRLGSGELLSCSLTCHLLSLPPFVKSSVLGTSYISVNVVGLEDIAVNNQSAFDVYFVFQWGK